MISKSVMFSIEVLLSTISSPCVGLLEISSIPSFIVSVKELQLNNSNMVNMATSVAYNRFINQGTPFLMFLGLIIHSMRWISAFILCIVNLVELYSFENWKIVLELKMLG